VYRTNSPIDGTEWRFELVDGLRRYIDDLEYHFPDLSRKQMRKREAEARRQAAEDEKYWRRQRKQQQARKRRKSTTSTKCILTPRAGQSARLYNRGIFVRNLDNALFSYNLNTEAINRDRDMVDNFALVEGVSQAFNSSDVTAPQMVKYWENSTSGYDYGPTKIEYLESIQITNERNRKRMVGAFYKAFGKGRSRKVCLQTDRFAASDAAASGWQVVDLKDTAHRTAAALGIAEDWQAAGYTKDGMKPMQRVPKRIKRQIAKFHQLASLMDWEQYEVVPVNRLPNDDGTRGMFSENKIWVMRDAWEGDSFELLRTLVHETGHGESESSDGTRRFTQWFETLAVKAMAGDVPQDVMQVVNEFLKI
jgi:hypothetical protein